MRSIVNARSIKFEYLLYLALAAYLVIGTGMASDDFIYTLTMKGKSVAASVNPMLCLHTPMENIFFFFWYPFFSLDNTLLVDIVKTLYVLLSFYMVSKFFGIFLNIRHALLASFLFVFFPSHDATVYWFLGQYLALSMAFYLFAYYLAHRGRLIPAFLSAVAASFLSYGSTAIAIPLFLLFIFDKDVKKGLAILVPNIIYVAYYIFIVRLVPGAINRFSGDIGIVSFARQFIFQILTFCDAVLGPSMWLKIYYSILQISVPSIGVGIFLTYLLARSFKDKTAGRYDIKLITCLAAMALVSFALFAMTGAYPQLAFNLGDRVTIFSSLLVAYLIVALPAARGLKVAAFSILIFSILGLSDHWKAWNIHEKAIMTNIMNNKELRDYKDNKTIFISRNQYSKLGEFSHIEFFSEGGPGCIFSIILGRSVVTNSINSRFEYTDGRVIDTKYGGSIEVEDYIMVYDSEKYSLFRVNEKDINRYVNSLPRDVRHWTQLPSFRFFRELAVSFMPRLKYAI